MYRKGNSICISTSCKFVFNDNHLVFRQLWSGVFDLVNNNFVLSVFRVLEKFFSFPSLYKTFKVSFGQFPGLPFS